MGARPSTGVRSTVRYGLSETAHQEWIGLVRTLAARPDVVHVCDAGGGAVPLLSLDEVERYGVSCTILDVSEAELVKAPAGYRTTLADLSSRRFEPDRSYDLVFSRFLAEHVRQPEVFHGNILRMLRPGGLATHYFPTLYAPPFVANKLLPEALTDPILRRVNPWRGPHSPYGKFRAYYRWCRGPSRRQLARLRGAGFEVEAYVGFFGFGGYFPIRALERLDNKLSRLLAGRPVSWYTAYAYVVLRRPR
jgi:SAM-dependent methyltransferase